MQFLHSLILVLIRADVCLIEHSIPDPFGI